MRLNKKSGLTFTIFITILLFINSASASMKYCNGDTLIENITINNDTILLPTDCDYGCSDETILGLGMPGCQESPLLLGILTIIIAFIFIFLIRWVIYK